MNKTQARVLIVEDEINLAEVIQDNLESEGYLVELAGDGITGLDRILKGDYDLVILDVMMPGLDGFTVCKRARDEGCESPVLFLTAKDGVESRVQGLQAGADDYLPKPFHLQELLLRVKAIIRRRTWYDQMPPGSSLEFAGNTVNFRTYQGTSWTGELHQLSQKETMILKCLAERAKEVVTREEILEKVWGYDIYPATRVIEEFVTSLCQRFERDPRKPNHIRTVRGVGYTFIHDENTNHE